MLCSNNLNDFGLKKGLDNLDAVRQTFKVITSRFAGFQASAQRSRRLPLLQRIALPSPSFGPLTRYQNPRQTRHSAPRGSVAWRTSRRRLDREGNPQAVRTTFGLSEPSYGLNQLRYDLRKLKGHGLLERDGSRLRLPPHLKGVQVALLFLFFHKQLCGPLANSRFHRRPDPQHRPDSRLEAATTAPTTPSRTFVDLLARVTTLQLLECLV